MQWEQENNDTKEERQLFKNTVVECAQNVCGM